MENSAFDSFDTMQIDGAVKNYLTNSAKWARFLGIVGFISTILILFGAISMFMLGSRMRGFPGLPFSPSLLGFMYLIAAVISFFASLHFYNFGTKMLSAVESNSKELLEKATKSLNSWFKLAGIITIITLAIYGLILLLGIIGSIFR